MPKQWNFIQIYLMIRKSSYVHNPVVWICFRALEVGGVGVLPGVDPTGALVLGGSVVPGESEAPAVESVELGESGGKEVETGKAVEVGIVSLGAESRILLKTCIRSRRLCYE